MKIRYSIILGGLIFSACTGFSAIEWINRNRYTSNGEQIYFTAINTDGQRIAYSGGPALVGMMGISRLNCASCHDRNGSGGSHMMHMRIMTAPDIRFSTLSDEEDVHNDQPDGEDGHELEHSVMNIEMFRLAVVSGKHPNGDSLSRDMPRWQFNDNDLLDLFNYIASLD